MLELKSRREIEKMRIPGRVVAEAHAAAAARIAEGVCTSELEQVIADTFHRHDAEPLFLNYPGEVPFPAVSCISVNEEVVHGIPSDRSLQVGDIVSIDTGCRIGGWCGDAAVTHAVGPIDEESQRLLEVTAGVLNLAIERLQPGVLWSEIAREMQAEVERAGLAVIRDFVGHGIGREMHQEPQVPNFISDRLLGETDFEIRPGLVLAIEPMVATGKHEVCCLDDHWTQVTADGGRAAHFEHTVAVTADGATILTQMT